MPDAALATPPAHRLQSPSWLDGRLIVGVILVLLSVVVGAKIVAASGDYDQIWAASHDLAPGTTITGGDLVAVKVRFHDHASGYFSMSGMSLIGRTTVAALSRGQLIPVAALPATPPTPTRLVTVPVAKLHMPHGSDLQGTQVDLYVTLKTAASGGANTPQLVLANVTVADTINDSSLGGSDGSAVVLAVPVGDVDAVVGAVESGSIDLVRVPSDQTASFPSPGAFASTLPNATAPPAAASSARNPVGGTT
jgi:SAF domain